MESKLRDKKGGVIMDLGNRRPPRLRSGAVLEGLCLQMNSTGSWPEGASVPRETPTENQEKNISGCNSLIPDYTCRSWILGGSLEESSFTPHVLTKVAGHPSQIEDF